MENVEQLEFRIFHSIKQFSVSSTAMFHHTQRERTRSKRTKHLRHQQLPHNNQTSQMEYITFDYVLFSLSQHGHSWQKVCKGAIDCSASCMNGAYIVPKLSRTHAHSDISWEWFVPSFKQSNGKVLECCRTELKSIMWLKVRFVIYCKHSA